MLTKRAEDIIRVLLRFPQDNPITISIISDELNISTRSVQRELPTVESWLSRNHFRLVRKRSVGLLLDEPEERRQEILVLLNNSKTPAFAVEDKKKRQDMLCHDILFADEPIKSYYFQDTFGISEGTLTSDLNRLETWFHRYKLTLHRRQGLGIFIEGTEQAKRQAVTSFLCRQMNEMRDLDQGKDSDLSRLNKLQVDLNQEITDGVSNIIDECEETLQLDLSDSAYQHLLVYLSYMVNRIQDGCYVEADEDEALIDINGEPEFAIAEYFMRQLRQEFNLPIIDSETIYLTKFLSGIHIWSSDTRDLTRKRDFDIHQMTLELIRNVSDYLDMDFSKDERLPSELSAHLQPTLGRLRAGIPIENPLLSDFQNSYSDIYEACEAGTSALSEVYGLPAFPATEIGFITIYFAMAMDRRRKLAKRISVMIVCPTGIGSSRLLSSSLKQEYPDLDIRGTTSAFDIEPEQLEASGIDLIISTVKLDTTFRWICVNPILTKQDKMLLESKLNALTKLRKNLGKQVRVPSLPVTRDDIHYITSLANEIFSLLENIRIGQAPVLQSREEIISYASSLFADTPETEQHFYTIMKHRDQIADTYMKPFHALLLHGKSSLIEHPCFGYVRLEPPVYENGRIILGAIVSFIPDSPDNQISASVASEIIGSLLEDPALLKALHNTDDELFRRLLEVALLRFYKKSVLEKLS